MLVRCPKCLSKARIAASEQMGDQTRYLYVQCQNLNCSTTMRFSLSFDHYTRTPAEGSEPPDPEKQPELLKDPRQGNLLFDDHGESGDAE